MSVPLDTRDEIHELADQGYGRNQISVFTGVSSETVRGILNGRQSVEFSEEMSSRQIADKLRSWSPCGR